MKRIPSIIVLFILTFSACTPSKPVSTPQANISTQTMISIDTLASATPTFAAPPTASATPLPARPTKTTAPTQTVIPFLSNTSTPVSGSPTPSVPTAFSPDGSDAQCFRGPGIAYEPSYTYKTAEIVGKDATGLWWYIKMYNKLGRFLFCWVDMKRTGTAGDLSNVPMTEAENASVTAVNISLDGDYIQTVSCDKNADRPEFRFTGEIVTNGPVQKLRVQWETNAGAKFPPEQIQVLAWDNPSRLKLNLPVPAQDGMYSLTLRTIYPNEIVRVVQFVVKCQ